MARTWEIAEHFVKRLISDGLDWMQSLDQNVGCPAFPCFAADHGHPPMPGKWMNTAMQSPLDSFRKIADEETERSKGQRRFAFSVEYPPNEFFMPNFQVADQRIAPPGHAPYERLFFPLHSFLYHEFVITQGGFGSAPEPYHMPIRNAFNLVAGEIPSGVLTGDGSLLNRDTFNWAPRNPPVGNNDDSLAMLRAVAALRRGKNSIADSLDFWGMGHSELNRKPGTHKQHDQQERILGGTCTWQRPASDKPTWVFGDPSSLKREIVWRHLPLWENHFRATRSHLTPRAQGHFQ